ncbi:hypothetical protein [uncultured Porphyromonas sp.]|uniref:AbiTii domain-containing protein n=1 Tax=uncultured Porphyromonas sp. TaxID=159274 RepID=UPI002597EC70|nr:hypothetical protein [uncultured Porphyromonas sp.]
MTNLIDNIIKDLGDDKPIKGILLKSQILGSKLQNKEFQDWIHNEQCGYKNSKGVPDYRVLNVVVKADIHQPYCCIVSNYPLPMDSFKDKAINKLITQQAITCPLSEIETLCSDNKSENLVMTCPIQVYSEVSKYVNGNVTRVFKEVPASAVLGIVDAFKSKLLAFFLELDDKIHAGVNFSNIDSQKEIRQILTTYNINAVVANTGNGSVVTGNIIDNDSIQYISDGGRKRQLQELVTELKKEVSNINNQDLRTTVDIITKACEKPTWCKSTLRMAFNAIKGIAVGIAANQLTPIVAKALELL